MFNRKLAIIILLSLWVVFWLCQFTSVVFAAETKPLRLKLNIAIPGLKEFSQGEGVIINNETLAKYIGGLYRFFVGIAGILAVFMITFGGIQWLFSGGSAERVTQAKETIIGAVVGLILAIGSYTILYTINPRLVKFPAIGVTHIEPYVEDTGLVCQEVKNSAEGCNVYSVDSGNIISAGSHVILSMQQGVKDDFNNLAQAWFDSTSNPNHIKLKINSMFRSYSYQYCLHLKNSEIANEAGFSTHEKGLAFDMNTQDLTAEEYYTFVDLAKVYKFKVANSNYGRSESWHFTYQGGVNNLCYICPNISVCKYPELPEPRGAGSYY